MNIIELYKRWRHTRGFGVHSPFAYRIVMEVINPPSNYAYYAELRPGMTPMERIIYRLGVFLVNEHLPKALRLDEGMTHKKEERREHRLKQWLVHHNTPLVTIRPAPEERRAIEEAMMEAGLGMVLSGRKYLIAIPRKEMAYVNYDIL